MWWSKDEAVDEIDKNVLERLTRAEQDILNNKETFMNFKKDDFVSLKKEVQIMRGELNTKIDQLLEKITAINMTLAKWSVGVGALVFVGEIVVKKFFN